MGMAEPCCWPGPRDDHALRTFPLIDQFKYDYAMVDSKQSASTDVIHSGPGQPSAWSRILPWVVAALIFVVAVVTFLPSIIAHTPLRHLLARGIQKKTGARVSVGEASLGWFSGVELTNLTIHNSLDKNVGKIATIRLERSPWQLLLRPSQLGTVTIDHPELTIRITNNETNLIFEPLNEDRKGNRNGRMRPKRPKKAVLHLRHGRVLLAADNLLRPHVLFPDLNVNARIDEMASSRTVDIDPFTLLDRAEASRELCAFGLKYVAPILANASWAKGTVSAQFDECHLDLADRHNSHLRGRLAIHALEAGPNSPVFQMVTGIVAKLLRRDSIESVKLAKESEIRFRLSEDRVYHTGLEFGLPDVSSDLVIRSHGSVGIDDQSLDLYVDIPLPVPLLSDSKLAQALGNQTLHIPISGTLEKPNIQFRGDGRVFSDILAKIVDAGANDELDLSELLKRLRAHRRNKKDDQEQAEEHGGSRSVLERLRGLRNRVRSGDGDDTLDPGPALGQSTGETDSEDSTRPSDAGRRGRLRRRLLPRR